MGPTLGAGGTAIWQDGTLHRAKNFKAHRIIAAGPVRAIFELEYEPWDAAGTQVSETKRISIDAGQNLFRQESTFPSPAGGELAIAVGTVKRAGLVGATRNSGNLAWMSTWGPVERKNGGHGSLGTAVVIPADRVVETGDHYLVITRAASGSPVTWYSGAGWTASGDFASVEAWWAYLDGFAQRVRAPVAVEVR